MITTSVFYKSIALFTAASLLFQTLMPYKAMALSGGPTQPEFSNFESVTTNKMVNEFTGDFTYNLPVIDIPGPNGGGYSLSLSYHSGVSQEEDASWVGYGWTLNPGAIIRNKRGFADDVDSGAVKYFTKTPTNWTISIGTNGDIGIRAFGIIGASIGLNSVIEYNSYKGLNTSAIPYVGYKLGLK